MLHSLSAWGLVLHQKQVSDLQTPARTNHTHHPVDDAKGNAEALLPMKDELGLKIRL